MTTLYSKYSSSGLIISNNIKLELSESAKERVLKSRNYLNEKLEKTDDRLFVVSIFVVNPYIRSEF